MKQISHIKPGFRLDYKFLQDIFAIKGVRARDTKLQDWVMQDYTAVANTPHPIA